MRKNSLLVMTICAMATILVAGRCSDDDEKAAAGGESSAQEAAPIDSLKDEGKGTVDAGVETDPLGETLGGPDDMTAPMEEPGAAGDDVGLDDPSFEPESVPEEAADL